jgi:hypothetical protein
MAPATLHLHHRNKKFPVILSKSPKNPEKIENEKRKHLLHKDNDVVYKKIKFLFRVVSIYVLNALPLLRRSR